MSPVSLYSYKLIVIDALVWKQHYDAAADWMGHDFN